MKAKFFLQMMFLLCMGCLFSPKALANVLLTWGFLQSPCIKGCSCAGSTPGSVWKWRYASTGELAGRSSGFRNTIYESPTCYFPVGISSFLSRMSLGDLIPSNAETCCFSSSLRKTESLEAITMLSTCSVISFWFYLCFSFPQVLPPLPVAAQSCAPLSSTLRMGPCVLSSLTFASPEWSMWGFRPAIFWIVSLVNSWRAQSKEFLCILQGNFWKEESKLCLSPKTLPHKRVCDQKQHLIMFIFHKSPPSGVLLVPQFLFPKVFLAL